MFIHRRPATSVLVALLVALAPTLFAAGPATAQAGEPDSTAGASRASIERGRYLVATSGCNDCHTEGYLTTDGKVAERDWLKGSTLGWTGAWGTTYPPNLRLSAARLPRSAWIEFARSPRRPPMPWFNVAAMTRDDVGAIYDFLAALGPAGVPAPVALGASQVAPGATVVFPGAPAPRPSSASTSAPAPAKGAH